MATPFTTAPALATRIVPLVGSAASSQPLFERIADARVVLIGEASHGTHEFYYERAEITKRLIGECGFTAVAAEADWPDAYRVNAYVRGESRATTPAQALAGFERFPTWMWRNTEVASFVAWLRRHNANLPPGGLAAGFYGLDLYSLYRSIEAVIDYLERVDPAAAQAARDRYACFEVGDHEAQTYGEFAFFGIRPSCEDEAVRQLVDLQARASQYARLDGRVARDDYFYALQNARLVKDAEEYYRTMFSRRVSSWNLRDQHMATTLEQLLDFLEERDGCAKVVIWAHNTHIGDARATDMGVEGELNVGQLARQQFGRHAHSIGFTTYMGTVSAASDWGGHIERKRVRPGLAGSYETLFHNLAQPRFYLPLEGRPVADDRLLERAIGVIYRPESERLSHYFGAWLHNQFDAVIHLDHTSALEPLERTAHWDAGEPPETYPTGE